MSASRMLFLFLIYFAAGCAHSIHEVHVSDFSKEAPLESGSLVRAEKEQFVVLGFAKNTYYVDSARMELIKGCPDGEVTGITTQFATSLGFLSWTNKILMQGLCLKN